MAIIRVGNQNQLEKALMDVRGGDTIMLASGRYSELNMISAWNKSFRFSEKVTITSADKSDPAHINQMFLRDVRNVEIRDVDFDHNGRNAAGTESFRQKTPFFVEKAQNVTIDEANFEGARIGGYGTGTGLRIKNSAGIAVTDSTFDGFLNGMNVSNSSDLRIARNLVTGMANDGMTFGGVDGAKLIGNEFRDFHSPNPLSLHKDNIQFRVDTGEAASKNIVIRNNLIDSAEMRHGIYFGNELAKAGIKADSTYENILIEGNLIRSAHTYGITVFQGNGIYIRNNTLEQNPDLGYNDKAVYVPRINVSKYSDNVLIAGNDVISVQKAQNHSWTVSRNDTGERQLYHWDGTEYAAYNQNRFGDILDAPSGKPVFRTTASPAPLGGASLINLTLSGDELRFNGLLIDDETTVMIRGFNIARGNTLVLEGFAPGTFRSVDDDGNHLAVWGQGAGARIDSMRDFHELNAASSKVHMSMDDGDLVMDFQLSRGSGELVLAGLGGAYAAGDPLNLV